MDFACSAASLLIVVDDVLRCVPVELPMKNAIDRILSDMVARGDSAAASRLQEIRQLQDYAARVRSFLSMNTSPLIASKVGTTPVEVAVGLSPFDKLQATSLNQDGDDYQRHHRQSYPGETMIPGSVSASSDLTMNFDLSQDHMLTVADQLDVDAFSIPLDLDEFGPQDWLDIS